MKVYGISAAGESPPDSLVEAGLAAAAGVLPPIHEGHGVGFVGIHAGLGAWFAFASWWANLYELNHVLFRTRVGDPPSLARVPPPLFGCTWDLHVIAFERDAWIRTLTAAGGPDPDAYLALCLDATEV